MQTVNDNMENITSLKRSFSLLVNKPPRYNPHTRPGRAKFNEWQEECKEMEQQLRSAGVDL